MLLLCSVLVLVFQLYTFRTIVWDIKNGGKVISDLPHHETTTASRYVDEFRPALQRAEAAAATTIPAVDSRDSNYFSACLLVKDDNHYLVEWLAYHYHVLPLRRLIIAIDPKSQTSPTNILRRYAGATTATRNNGSRMHITQWTDDDFFPQLHRSIVMGESFKTSSSTVDSGNNNSIRKSDNRTSTKKSSLAAATTTTASFGNVGSVAGSEAEKKMVKRRLRSNNNSVLDNSTTASTATTTTRIVTSGNNNFESSFSSIIINSINISSNYNNNNNTIIKYRKPHKTKDEKLVLLHRTRQRHFFASCMKQLQDENRTWTALIDSDEFIVPNYNHAYFKRKRRSRNKGNLPIEGAASNIFFWKYFVRLAQALIPMSGDATKQSSSLSTATAATEKLKNSSTGTDATPTSPTTILRTLHTVQDDIDSSSTDIYNRNKHPLIKDVMMKSPCISMPRILIGTKESPTNELESPLSKDILNHINATDFLTLRWRYYGTVKEKNKEIVKDVVNSAKPKHQPGKAIVDVSRIARKSLSVLHVLNPHRPVEECLTENTWITSKQSLFLSHHYVGTYLQWTFRDDPRTGASTKSKKAATTISNSTVPKKTSSTMIATTATRSRERYETFAQLHAHSIDDSIRGWLQDFIQKEGLESALELLKGAGQIGVQ